VKPRRDDGQADSLYVLVIACALAVIANDVALIVAVLR